ncbi:ABC transporter permease [Desulfotomaculum sp. 1211_IL3151]|uniref:ABC transporter permease n=1 Tax=Desulfotomaculum sp. 1211_IL3151 TaxID=3084055 RepID=UPI002FDB0731
MNNSWIRCLKAIIWKESIEAIRTSKLAIPSTILFVVGIQLISVYQIIGKQHLSSANKELILAGLTIFIPLMSITFFGNGLLLKTIHEERLNKTIHVLLASGVPPTALWVGKFLVASTISYIISAITISGFVSVINLFFGYSFNITSSLWLILLVIMPLLSIGMLAVVSLLYWYLKDARTLGSIIQMVAFLGVWNFSLKFGSKYPINMVGLISLVIGILLIGLSFTLIKYISKERIVNV